jgi:hypothetical protein
LVYSVMSSCSTPSFTGCATTRETTTNRPQRFSFFKMNFIRSELSINQSGIINNVRKARTRSCNVRDCVSQNS